MSLLYIVKEGFSGFGRAKLPAAVTVAISFFALVILGLFGTVSLSFYDLIQELRGRVELELFFSDSMDEESARQAAERIGEVPGVARTEFVTKEEAAAIFQKDFGEDVVRILGSNPLPRSLRVRFDPAWARPDSLEAMAPRITALAPGSEIRYNRFFLGRIEQNARLFTLITGGVGLLISVATLVMVGYTIRLAMYSRIEKIRTMRLVGATGMFIASPYVIEGALQGLLSGLLASGAVYLIFEQLLLRYEPGVYEVLHPSVLYIYPALVVLGLLLGFFGSAFAVGKFLRVVSRRR